MDSRNRLIRILRDRSYREGDFTLVSGQKSSFYLDGKATTLHPEGAHLIGEAACDLLEKEGLAKLGVIEGVGGLVIGADPIATAVSLAAYRRGHYWPAFLVRKEAKAHGTKRYTEGVENLSPGASLLVVEDVMTTGGSSLLAVERLRSEGFRPVAVLTLVDREQGGAEKVAEAGLRFLRLSTISEIRAALPRSS